jgi:hypothetical protein
MMFVAAYFAGWMSHRAWNRQNVADTISRAVEEANIPVKVDHLEGVDVFVTRGRKEDVEKVTAIIDDIEDAARK